MSHQNILLLSIILPALITTFLPSNLLSPGIFSKFIFFSLLLWLGREIRLNIREWILRKRAKAWGGKLAPRVNSNLPFGISLILHRLKQLSIGTPQSAIEFFNEFPIGTQVIRTRHLGTETILTKSHLDAKHILTSPGFTNWGKSLHLKQAFKPLLGDGVFASDQRGLWSWHRALTRPHFAKERIADVKASEEHADRVVEWLEKKAMAHEAIDIQDLFSRFTLTVGTQHLFGECVDTLNDLFGDRPSNPESIDAARFSKDFAAAQERCLKMMILPRKYMTRNIPDKALEGVFEVVNGLVAKTEGDQIEHEDEHSEYLIQHLRRSGASPDLIRQESLNILLAARDTTASLLTSCIFELAGRHELWSKLKSDIGTSSISLDELRKLKYLRAVINESLRLHPPVWANSRHAFEDDLLPSGTFVAAGTDCRFFIREFQRDPELWGKDADDFVPERWIDGRQIKQSKDPFSYQPFSAGPRICLGQQFAYTEVSIALSKLIKAFSSAELIDSRSSFEELPGVTLSVRGGLWVRFQK
ncbi:hypothetical protein CROQUDRAFT_50276 [Cronartium quercuum f. sp. fusiforme G11]|uniref:Cytochrome P450 n=1 Tax=Cronartium quercuum f. sp. fusiforme G11 TaxID=708437 RepID=A0A9P6T8D7_9BASI|nr:hypothetical protein CROQUDRAFT_50276 [Cronartium quercuum f. sp. fusiforme G11]